MNFEVSSMNSSTSGLVNKNNLSTSFLNRKKSQMSFFFQSVLLILERAGPIRETSVIPSSLRQSPRVCTRGSDSGTDVDGPLSLPLKGSPATKGLALLFSWDGHKGDHYLWKQTFHSRVDILADADGCLAHRLPPPPGYQEDPDSIG